MVDSLKIEGRTKSPYYAAITAKAYREAIDDFYHDKFEGEKYQRELKTTKHRGFTDAYLVSRPFEKEDTQKHDNAISAGSYEVAGLVREDGNYFMCKYKIYPEEEVELVIPQNQQITYCENEIGKIYKRDGKNFILFKKIVTESDRELESVHSGNLNPIALPCALPAFSLLRKPVEEEN